jgi:serine/threonine protein kinase/predicted Zn-dependent protease
MNVLPQTTGCAALAVGTSHQEASVDSRFPTLRSVVLDELNSAWERGERPHLETYLERLAPFDREGAVELIYRHFCLVEAAGGDPDPQAYRDQFPGYDDALKPLLRLHAECSPSLLHRWFSATAKFADLPEVGDSIGPFSLRRELGRGSFARVFLAAQTDLENRLVVIKVCTRATREPWLLARVRHPHVVEIISHATVDDGAFQLICMPFWGGATFGAVLAAGRKRRNRPASGRDLLADLDTVAAPEYPSDNPSQSARQIISTMNYGQTVAWIVARLAEALDCAFHRGVAHGDVKPSNILLSADANPMMLDFNLARDWAAAGPEASLTDPGGTLAYMAPERLRDLAHAGRMEVGAGFCGPCAGPNFGGADPVSVSGEQEGGLPISDRRPHLADIYSLGIVLIEALAGRPLEPVVFPAGGDSSWRRTSLSSAALAIADARSASPATLIRRSLTAAGYSTSCGLQSILERCLDPNPLARYERGWELAQDLDRWRNDRPLAFASEPLWSQALPRWVRRRRRLLFGICATLVAGLSGLVVASQWSSRVLQQLPLFKYERYLDDPADYRFRRPSIAASHVSRKPSPANQGTEFDDPRDITAAVRALRDYGVITSREWRLRDDVRLLPAADRDDLELWLMEQAYRYSRALIAESASRAACDRAVSILDNAASALATPAFDALRLRLAAQFKTHTAAPNAGAVDSGRQADKVTAAHPWIDEYLLGVAAEYQLEPEAAASQALDHYDNMLEYRPRSYWGHYRAAAMCFRLGQNADAVSHLRKCLNRRPENALLRGQRAACLALLNQCSEALRELDQALDGNPDVAELFQNRALIRASLGTTEGVADDIEHFEVLSHLLPRSFWGRPSSVPGPPPDERPQPVLDLPGSAGSGALHHRWPSDADALPGVAEVEPDELNARLVIARKIQEAGDLELAAAEFSKALLFDPNNLAARMERALLAIQSGQFQDAGRDIERVLAHPGLNAYLAEHPDFINGLYSAASEYLNRAKVAEGRALARRALDLAISAKLSRGCCHYIVARAYVMSSSTNPEMIEEAAKHLGHAFSAKDDYYRPFYEHDTEFDSVRTKIDSYLALKSGSKPPGK